MNPALFKNEKLDQLPLALVVGGAGFIGSHLCEALLQKKLKVVCLDNLATGKKENLKNCLANPAFSFLDQDINNHNLISSLKPDYIFCLVNSLDTKNILDLAKKENSKLLLVNSLDDFNLNVRAVHLKDCYGPRMSLEEGSPLSKFFKEAVMSDTLTLENEGLDILHPTFVADIVEGIEKAMFSPDTNGKIFSLVNPEETTSVNFVSALQKQSPKDFKNVYIKGKNSFQFPQTPMEIKKTEKELDWNPQTSLDLGIKKTLEYFSAQLPPIPPIPHFSSSHLKTKSFIYKKPALLASLLLLFSFVFLPFIYLSLRIALGLFNLDAAKNSLEKGRIIQSKSQSISAQNNFYLAKNSLSSLDWIATVFKLRKTSSLLSANLEVGGKASLVLRHAALLLESGQGDFSENILTNSRLELGEIDKNLALIQAISDKQKLNCPLPISNCQKLLAFLPQIPKLRQLLNRGDKILSVFPAILDANSSKSYLLLFQNNMELRGGGGFIGSYGLLKLENGQISGLKIDDIYSIDGQLKGKVIPPDEILHYLGQPNWYLRDSNLEADFPLNAKRALWFFEKETGTLADGVIALDLTAVQKILEITGPLKIPDYDQEITSQNLFALAESHSEVNFFPGSTQKKDFLSGLGRALLNELLKNQNKYSLFLLSKISESLDEKHLLLYSSDGKIQSVLETIGAGGEVRNQYCSSDAYCLAAPLLITDNNFGANKVNLFLKRKISRTLTLGKEGEVREKVNIVYQNKSPAETWPGGPYKNMLKIYAPLGSKLLSFNLGDEKTATTSSSLTAEVLKSLSPDEFLVYESTQSGKTVWTTEVLVPVQKSKTVEILYELPEKISYKGDTISLNIFQQKQAGTDKDNFSLSVGYPSFLNIKETTPQKDVIANPQLIRYNTDLSVDRSLKIDFAR